MNDNTREFHPHQDPPIKPSRWYLLTGLMIGLLLGLVFALWINPVAYTDSHPASLSKPYKDTYRSLIAQVYAATGNFERAVLRLELLEDEDPVFALGAQAQRSLAEGKEAEAKALALLASAMQASSPQGENSPQQGDPIVIPTATLEFVPTQTLPGVTPAP